MANTKKRASSGSKRPGGKSFDKKAKPKRAAKSSRGGIRR